MDFDQVNSFLEVARHNSFSRAAEKCFRTQPAISSQIRALEEEVGARLFDRTGGKVSLTAAGKAFLRWAEEIMVSRRAMVNALAEMERTPSGEIVVGANEATCLHVLPEVFAQFKRQFPKVSVNIQRAERAKTLESILDNSVDFGVVSMPVNDARLTVSVIHRDELVLIAAPGHPLAKMKNVSVAELSQYPLVLPKLGRTRDAIDNLFYSAQLKTNISMELDSSELLKRFVAANVGIGFAPRLNIADELRASSLVTIPLRDIEMRRDLALVYRKDKALSRASLAFIDIAVQHKSQKIAAKQAK